MVKNKDKRIKAHLKTALKLMFPEFWEAVAVVHSIRDGKTVAVDRSTFHDGALHISEEMTYESGGVLEGEFRLQEISEKLQCTITVHYEGEQDDAEILEFVNGKKTVHKKLKWVSVL